MYFLFLIWFVVFMISLIYKHVIRRFTDDAEREKTVSTREVKTERRNNSTVETFGPPVETVQDPVCGVYVPESEAVSRVVFGEKIAFCSEKCAAKYQTEHAKIRPEAHAFTV